MAARRISVAMRIRISVCDYNNDTGNNNNQNNTTDASTITLMTKYIDDNAHTVRSDLGGDT